MAFQGELWFFTSADGPKVAESRWHRQVNVSFADPEHQDYVSISGTASLVRDRQKMEKLWSPGFSTGTFHIIARAGQAAGERHEARQWWVILARGVTHCR
jgi:hypothetical protein